METDRIQFMEDRDGKEAAMVFVKTTYNTYRRCVLNSRKRKIFRKSDKDYHPASLPEFRRSFIESCVAFRAYIYAQPSSPGPLA